MNQLEKHFEEFRNNTIGYHRFIPTPWGEQKLRYCDYTASGRLYLPIERKISDEFGPLVGNTHTESNLTGTAMTESYRFSRQKIKQHCNAGKNDILIHTGFGMTCAVNKLQRILGLRVPEFFKTRLHHRERPVVFLTHMEHHSNQITWLESIAEVVCLKPGPDGLVSLDNLEETLRKYRKRPAKIGSFTACSNVTGIETPYHKIAALMHKYGGLCFVDFAACAPYRPIDMHPADEQERLDGIFFSPHKFLGGPGTSGVLIFDGGLYKNTVPDMPGGGTVEWTNPWGGRKYIDDIELREDGGTPGFLQSIRAALAAGLKEKMGIREMAERDRQITSAVFRELSAVPGLHLLAPEIRERLPIISFYAERIHYNLFVRLLNDRFGIQVRGGCSCAGTYGHYLLNINKKISKSITDSISHGDLSHKPGWVRLSFHPMMTDDEIFYITEAVKEVIKQYSTWKEDYRYNKHTNQFVHRDPEKNRFISPESFFRL
jgi:selenocysteine lyase/cysteine desulfurase